VIFGSYSKTFLYKDSSCKKNTAQKGLSKIYKFEGGGKGEKKKKKKGAGAKPSPPSCLKTAWEKRGG